MTISPQEAPTEQRLRTQAGAGAVRKAATATAAAASVAAVDMPGRPVDMPVRPGLAKEAPGALPMTRGPGVVGQDSSNESGQQLPWFVRAATGIDGGLQHVQQTALFLLISQQLQWIRSLLSGEYSQDRALLYHFAALRIFCLSHKYIGPLLQHKLPHAINAR